MRFREDYTPEELKSVLDQITKTLDIDFERRKYPRFNVDLPTEYYRTNSSIRHSGRVMNMSESGLLIYFPERMKIGERLKLKLFITSGSDMNTIEPLGEVVWMDPHLDKTWGDYRSGVKFIDVSPEDIGKLKNFLMSFS